MDSLSRSTPMRRKRMRQGPSDKQAAKIARRIPVRDAYLRAHQYCEAKRAGIPFDCWGDFTVHEPWTRARGGPIDDPANMRVCCQAHNTAISQDTRAMNWAETVTDRLPYEGLFLVSAAQGAVWLELRRMHLEDTRG